MTLDKYERVWLTAVGGLIGSFMAALMVAYLIFEQASFKCTGQSLPQMKIYDSKVVGHLRLIVNHRRET